MYISPRRHSDGQQTDEKMVNTINHLGKQIKTTMSYVLMGVRMTIIKKTQTTSIGEDLEKRESSCIVSRNVNWGSSYKKVKWEVPQKMKNINYYMIQQFHLWVFALRKQKYSSNNKTIHPYVNCNAIYNSQDMDIYNRKIQTVFIYNSQDKCPLVNERIKTWYTNTHTHTHTHTHTMQHYLTKKNERNLAICEN